MSVSEVYQIDCLEYMRTLPDKRFSLAICDPPYGIGQDGGKTYQCPTRPNLYNSPAKHLKKVWDIKPESDYWKSLFRVTLNQIVCGGNYFSEYLPVSMGWVFWDKNIGGDFSDGELIYTSFNKALRKFVCHPFVGTNAGKSRIHPTQKPVALYKWLLQNYAKPGDTIFDSHLGSQSSRIAAWDLGFDFYGTEKDLDYFNEGNARFARHTAQPKLFQPNVAEVEQANLF